MPVILSPPKHSEQVFYEMLSLAQNEPSIASFSTNCTMHRPLSDSWCGTPWQVGTATAVDVTEMAPAFQEPPRTFFLKSSNCYSHSGHSPGRNKLSRVSDENLTLPKLHKERNQPLTPSHHLTHQCEPSRFSKQMQGVCCLASGCFPPHPDTQTSRSNLQILPHNLCANPSKPPSLPASELHCRIARCHLHHHHPKLSHDAPQPDLSTLCEPIANTKASVFSKYVAILEIAN